MTPRTLLPTSAVPPCMLSLTKAREVLQLCRSVTLRIHAFTPNNDVGYCVLRQSLEYGWSDPLLHATEWEAAAERSAERVASLAAGPTTFEAKYDA